MRRDATERAAAGDVLRHEGVNIGRGSFFMLVTTPGPDLPIVEGAVAPSRAFAATRLAFICADTSRS